MKAAEWWRTRRAGSAVWLYFEVTALRIEYVRADGKTVERGLSPTDQAKAVLGISVMSARSKLEKVGGLPDGAKLAGSALCRGCGPIEYFIEAL